MDVEIKKTKSNLIRTKTLCIYFDEVKKMYEVKCNYTIHDVNTDESKSSAINMYGAETLDQFLLLRMNY